MAKLNLAPREKRLVAVMCTIMVGMTLIPIYRNIDGRYTQSEKQLISARERQEYAQMLRTEILSAREDQKVIQAKLRARAGSFNLYTATNQWIQQTKLSGRADLQSQGLSSREGAIEGVQITLKNVGMNEILDLLHKMYDSENLITMQQMPYLRPARDGKGLDCSIIMIAPKQS